MSLSRNKKTGLFFGSFNPIHQGHLILAKYILNEYDLEEIWFVVSPQNPLKNKKSLLNEYHRLQMVRLAIEDEPKFKASDIEFKLEKPSYTINTLIHLDEKYKRPFVLIMGEDSAESITKWKNYEAILDNYEVYVYPRQGAVKSKIIQHPHLKFIHAPQLELSATYIRQAIKAGKDVRFLLHYKVYDFVKEMHFYEK
ncbi:MAG: nicotinate-nucleotide adenylyltransferase [Bacteroidia bacterium]|nr:nicotinate-nucleotide adenylyltransferase [Bacteroidia bacterium]MCZ2248404.1 nicotinate-nucleotide adenylyltransferase [Bacteroidia bacterium]